MNHARPILLATLLIVLTSTVAAQNQTSLAVTFTPDDITVTGATRGKTVVVFGIGIGSLNATALLTRQAEAADDNDGDGAVTFRGRRLVPNSVWVAVDLESGHYVIATPTGAAPAPLHLPEGAWRGQREHVEIPRGFLEALVVRPGKGAWALRMSEGGPNDADGNSNGVLTLRLDRMERLTGEEKGPPVALPRDLVVLVDPHTLQLFVSEAR